MVEFKLNGKVKKLPENWSEIEPKKLKSLIGLVYLTAESGIVYHEILRIVLGFSVKEWGAFCARFFPENTSEDVGVDNAFALKAILEKLRWMWTEPITELPFEYIKIGGIKYYLPTADFATISYGELADAYVHLQAYVKQLVEGEDRLNLLVATICRPKRTDEYLQDANWNGDIREPYNEFVAKESAKKLCKLPYEQRMLVLLYFAGALNKTLNSYDTFGASSRSESYPGQGFIKNQHLLATKGIYVGLDAVKKANAHEVLLFLQENKADVLEEIEHAKKQNEL